jgi:hypothetical protein
LTLLLYQQTWGYRKEELHQDFVKFVDFMDVMSDLVFDHLNVHFDLSNEIRVNFVGFVCHHQRQDLVPSFHFKYGSFGFKF